MPLGNDGVSCTIRFADGRSVGLEMIYSVSHVRGFRLGSSYCVIETLNPSLVSMNEFAIHSRFTIQYERKNKTTPPIDMEVFRIDNGVAMGNVCARIIAVEPGYIKMVEDTKIRSFQNQEISSVIRSIATDAGLKPKVQTTSGKATYIQPNTNDFQFVKEYLQPLAVDGNGHGPYLFTIDNGNFYFQLPILNQTPLANLVLSSHIDTIIKKWTVRNQGAQTDLAVGNKLRSYGYDHAQKGTIVLNQNIQGASSKALSKNTYSSTFVRTNHTPHDKQWMIQAHAANDQGRAQFTIEVDAIIEGSVDYSPGHLIQFSLVNESSLTLQEYSGTYYIYEILNSIKQNHFTAHMFLKSNATLKNIVAGKNI